MSRNGTRVPAEPRDPSTGRDDLGHAEAHETLTRILGAIEEYVYTGEFLPDDGYRVAFAGPCRERFLGMSVDQARSAVWADYVHPSDMEIFDAAHHGAQVTGRLDVEYRLVGADGDVRWVRDRGRVRNQDGRRFLDGSVLDVTAVRSAQEALEAARSEAHRISQVDPLTGVMNRRSLATQVERLGDRAVGMLSIDIDRFKNVNDLFGHAAGDVVLVAVADRLREQLREEDAIVRMGGEEFLVLLPDVLDETALQDVAESVRRRIAAEPVTTPGQDIEVTVSIGAARADSLVGAIEPLMAAADRALYAAKRSGRNAVRLASPDDGDEEVVAESDALRLAEAMAGVAAAADGISGEHLAEVSVLCARVARRLEGSPALVLRCRLAGLLHDIGKVKLPATILSGTEPLTEDEWRLVHAHPADGEALVASIPALRPLAPIVRQHHERFDGTGYPDGLAGEDILLEARIVAATDTWNAMTTDRPHRAAVDQETALATLERISGTQLDPVVVEALRSVIVSPREPVTAGPRGAFSAR